MLTGVILGIFIIPVLFVIFQSLQEKVSRKRVVETEEWTVAKPEYAN